MAEMSMRVDVALTEVPVNIAPLIDSSDFTTVLAAVAYNAAGMALVWNFTTANGVTTQTGVTPTSGGVYDWTIQGSGMYTIEIPLSGGGSINNDTEGFGWFTGKATGVLPWRGPIIQFIPDALADIEDGSQGVGSAQTGDSYAIVSSGTYGNAVIKTQVAAIETDTQDLQSRTPAALVGGRMDANMGAISADATAADNAESFFDGTGYAGTNNVIPLVTSVTTVTGNVNGNVAGSVANVVGNIGGSVASVLGNVSGSVGSVAGNVSGSVNSVVTGVTVTTNNDKTGYTLSTTGMNNVSDNFLDRDMSTGTDSGSPTVRTPRQALRALRNKNSAAAGIVYKENDTTPSWTYTVTTDVSASPITVIDPA